MSPVSDSASQALAGQNAVPAKLLDGGELVLLAIRPSGWYVLLVSAPALVMAGILGAGTWLGGRGVGLAIPYQSVVTFCVAVACVRILIACFQWMGRLYVLTNRRALWISGVMRVEVLQCSLARIRGTRLSATAGEKAVGIGTLLFELRDDQDGPGAWANIAHPKEVQEMVGQAIRRAG